jgi:hypothetical protein
MTKDILIRRRSWPLWRLDHFRVALIAQDDFYPFFWRVNVNPLHRLGLPLLLLLLLLLVLWRWLLLGRHGGADSVGLLLVFTMVGRLSLMRGGGDVLELHLFYYSRGHDRRIRKKTVPNGFEFV